MTFNELMAELDYWEYQEMRLKKQRHALVAKAAWSSDDEVLADWIDRALTENAESKALCYEALQEFD